MEEKKLYTQEEVDLITGSVYAEAYNAGLSDNGYKPTMGVSLPANDAVQNWFEENVDKECSASSAVYKFRLWLESLQAVRQAGAVWVKASERLPDKDRNYHVKATTKHQGYNHNDTAFWHNGKWEFDRENGRSVVEWLDESGSPAADIEWDSKRMIGRVRDRFDELEEKGHEWRSFYIGWLEGRADMLQQIKRWGKYKTPAAAREEDAVLLIKYIRENYKKRKDGWTDNFNIARLTDQGIYELFKQQKEK